MKVNSNHILLGLGVLFLSILSSYQKENTIKLSDTTEAVSQLQLDSGSIINVRSVRE